MRSITTKKVKNDQQRLILDWLRWVLDVHCNGATLQDLGHESQLSVDHVLPVSKMMKFVEGKGLDMDKVFAAVNHWTNHVISISNGINLEIGST